MRKISYVALASAAASAALTIDPSLAQGHALFGDSDPNRPLGSYLGLGFGHMVGGWDHLLFIAGVVLFAGNWRTAAKLISLFVLGHSLTLLVATLSGWQLNATVVDVVIALSLVYVGLQGWRGRPGNLRLTGTIVFGFGLVHGLGLSTRLQDLGLPESGLIERILLFNVGVELGQLVALGVIFGLGTLLARQISRRDQVRRAAFGSLILVGLVAAAVLGFPNGAVEDATEPVGIASGDCTQEQTTPPPLPPRGGHPSKPFYGPTEVVPTEDLQHIVNDGYVIVYYSPELTAADLQELESWVLSEQPSFVVGAPEAEQERAIEVVTAQEKLSCSELSIEDLTEFRDDWFETVRAEQMS